MKVTGITLVVIVLFAMVSPVAAAESFPVDGGWVIVRDGMTVVNNTPYNVMVCSLRGAGSVTINGFVVTFDGNQRSITRFGDVPTGSEVHFTGFSGSTYVSNCAMLVTSHAESRPVPDEWNRNRAIKANIVTGDKTADNPSMSK